MKTLLASLALVFLSACSSLPETSATNVQKEVLSATDAWRAAYDSRDPARIRAMYAPDATFWGTTMKTVAATPEAVAEYFKNAANRPNARVVLGEQKITLHGDVAVNAGAYTFKDMRDGKESSSPARFTMVFHRREGKWQLVHHHSSRLP